MIDFTEKETSLKDQGLWNNTGYIQGIHSTAIIENGARIDPTACIGPYATIGADVTIGPHCYIESHAILSGNTILGSGNRVGPHAILGACAQIRKSGKQHGSLKIGDGNWFREFVSVHCGKDGQQTTIGNGNFFMAYSHIAHDCQLGNGIELANGVQLGGHVVVDDDASFGGLAAVHQFVRVGQLAFIGAGSMVAQDVLPYALANGNRARIYGINRVGLKRNGFSERSCKEIRRALRLILTEPTLSQGLEMVRKNITASTFTKHLVSFAQTSNRGLCRFVLRGGA